MCGFVSIEFPILKPQLWELCVLCLGWPRIITTAHEEAALQPLKGTVVALTCSDKCKLLVSLTEAVQIAVVALCMVYEYTTST